VILSGFVFRTEVRTSHHRCSKFRGYALVLGFALCLPGDPGADPDAVEAVEAEEVGSWNDGRWKTLLNGST
jgi:hypothetical protein